MKNIDKKLLTLLIIPLILLLINYFFIKINNIYIILGFTVLYFIIFKLNIGIDKEKLFDKKKIIKITLFYSISFLIFKYTFGLFVGYLKSPYIYTIIYQFILPYAVIIVLSELIRYTIYNRSTSKIVFMCAVLLFTFIDITCLSNSSGLINNREVVIFIATTFNVCLFKSIGMSLITRRYGYISTIIYSLIYGLYAYILPIQPALGNYVDTIYQMLLPIMMYLLLNLALGKYVKDDPRKRHIVLKGVRLVLIGLIILVTVLNSNYFRFWIAVVASGSMSPTFEVGDVILVDKSYKNRIDDLKVGDILVFEMNDTVYTHRIINIDNSTGDVNITTQGDREGQAVDSWTVKKENIIGITKVRFKYIGLPAIYLRKLMEA